MATTIKCDICGEYYEAKSGSNEHICPCCSSLIKSFTETLKEGTLAPGLIDYLISVYGVEELKTMLEQRGNDDGGNKK